jgi:hypothetical protein
MAKALGLSVVEATEVIPRSRRTLFRWESRPRFKRRVRVYRRAILEALTAKIVEILADATVQWPPAA